MRTEFTRAVHSVVRTPAFALTTIAIVALGIGATTAMFALVNAVLLRELPYPDADRLISLGSRLPTDKLFAGRRLGLSQSQYFFLAGESRTLDAMGAYDSRVRPSALTGDGPAERVETAYATASLFTILGLKAELGRTIGLDDDLPGARGRVAVLGHDLWVRRYGSNPDLVGTSITIDGKRVPVIGVLRPGMQLPGRGVDVWFPLGADPTAPARNVHFLSAVAHVRNGVSFDAVRREMATLTARLAEAFPGVYGSPTMRRGGFTTDVKPLKDAVVGSTGRVLWILLAAVALVLVIAFANAANLFVARAHARRRESAIRAALGAGYRHLARQYMIESLVTTGLAGVVGVLVAFLMLRAFVAAAPWEVPRLNEVRFGLMAVVLAIAAALSAGVIFGLLQLTGLSSASTALKEEGRGTTLSRRQRTVQRAFVVGQVAMALMLLAACGMMVRSVRELQAVRPGVKSAGVLAVDVSLPQSRAATEESASAAWERLTEELSALPGVAQVAATQHAPLDGPAGCSAVFVEGRPPSTPGEEPPCVYTVSITPGYFATLEIPVRGGSLTWQDNDARSGGVVVSQALAERFWPREDPIGKGIRGNGGGPPYYRVIGVAADVHADGLDKPPVEAVYFPLISMPHAPLWDPPRDMTVLVRTRFTDAALLVPAVRRAVASVDPDAPITRVRTMDEVVASATARVRFIMAILTGAAAMALLLSCVGLYSVIAYITSQRRAEIGIRLALGARPRQVLLSVIAQSIGLAIIGVAFGLAGTVAVTGVLRAALTGVEPNDPVVLTAASLLVLAAAAAAGYLPARRAACLPPTEALR